MINLDPWYKFVLNIMDKDTVSEFNINDDELRFNIINIMSHMCTVMINDVLYKFTADCNVPEERRPLINMKNEYLFDRMILTSSKKNYA